MSLLEEIKELLFPVWGYFKPFFTQDSNNNPKSGEVKGVNTSTKCNNYIFAIGSTINVNQETKVSVKNTKESL